MGGKGGGADVRWGEGGGRRRMGNEGRWEKGPVL